MNFIGHDLVTFPSQFHGNAAAADLKSGGRNGRSESGTSQRGRGRGKSWSVKN